MLPLAIVSDDILVEVLFSCPPHKDLIGVDTYKDDAIIILITNLLPGPVVKNLVPGCRNFNLSLVTTNHTIMIRVERFGYFVPQTLQQLLNQLLTLTTLTLRGWDVAEGLELAIFPDALL